MHVTTNKTQSLETKFCKCSNQRSVFLPPHAKCKHRVPTCRSPKVFCAHLCFALDWGSGTQDTPSPSSESATRGRAETPPVWNFTFVFTTFLWLKATGPLAQKSVEPLHMSTAIFPSNRHSVSKPHVAREFVHFRLMRVQRG